MRRPRRKTAAIVLAALLVLAALATLGFWLTPSAPEPSLTTYSSLNPGMTEAEVADLLGPPTADITGLKSLSLSDDIAALPPDKRLVYEGPKASIIVLYQPDGRATNFSIKVRESGTAERLWLKVRAAMP